MEINVDVSKAVMNDEASRRVWSVRIIDAFPYVVTYVFMISFVYLPGADQ
jgi:hypothetical protein